ncbi:MAG: recombination protein RmuC [Patescibacteria group bacterium]|nr:recombination protein RmuC [Patescibacteria group bacterium]
MSGDLILVVMTIGLGMFILGFLVLKKLTEIQGGGASSKESEVLRQDIQFLEQKLGVLNESLRDQVNNRLDKNHDLMSSTFQKQFKQSQDIIADVNTRLAKLDEANKQVMDVTSELKTLQNVLQNPKQRGVLGEYHLETVLANVLPPGRFQLQYKFKNGETVDAVVFLQDGKVLPVDSKFSLENYNRLIDAKDKDKREALANLFKADLKKRIDETAKYIRPKEDTMDFAFMFIPSEAIYYDLLVNKVGASGVQARDLLEYAFQDKKVIIVSPTSFMAYLQTVLQGLRSLHIEEQAKEIQKRVGDLARHIGTYEGFMQSLGKSLGTTVNHYNKAHKELGKIDKDVMKISGKDTGLGPSVDPLSLDKPTEE